MNHAHTHRAAWLAALLAVIGWPAFAGEAPILHPEPGEGLLPPGATSVSLAVETAAKTACRFAVGEALPFERMKPFDKSDNGRGSRRHRTTVTGLDPSPTVVNRVHVRCEAQPQFALTLRYRALPAVQPRFPRTGNLWGWWGFRDHRPEHLAKIDLWLGANGMKADLIRKLRRLNPNLLVLTSINAVENNEVPADYFLKDIHGNRVEVWPGSYRLNLTRPEVADFQANYAVRLILENDLQFDGCFFDNVFLSQSWQKADIRGRAFPYDSDGDGKPDDPQVLDRRWRAGVLRQLQTFRRRLPHALTCGHALDLGEPVVREAFNGISFGFYVPNVIEGRSGFGDFLSLYDAWMTRTRAPHLTMIESAPPNQIGYGYGYEPMKTIPPRTLEFARTFYPYMRFGLALTLLSDGYFAHEIGDTWHGNDWWYDELDFNLGAPLGPASRFPKSSPTGREVVQNGDFAAGVQDRWGVWAEKTSGYSAAVSPAEGPSPGGHAARVDILATRGEDWRVDFSQARLALRAGAEYEVRFHVRADRARPLKVVSSKGQPDWRGYGLAAEVEAGPGWKEHVLSFTATETAGDARLQFLLGGEAGSVWLSGISLRETKPSVFRRDYERGIVLLNPSREPRTVALGPGFARLVGSQAPRWQFILDDDGPEFQSEGPWRRETLDSGEWKADGPYFHDWGKCCQVSTGDAARARWTLTAPADDTFTVEAWWPALPKNSWTKEAKFEIVVDGDVVGGLSLDQSRDGDQWHRIGEVRLHAGQKAEIRVRPLDGRPCVADALHVTSQSRYNDGSPAESVQLAPMDGIILRRAK
jgi:hypothetical protein